MPGSRCRSCPRLRGILVIAGTAVEPGVGSDLEDDGRGFSSAGWGNGHEGAGIEILGVAFVNVHLPK
ncbi:hypothetical protein BJV78DRAFT_1252171 [Lactifluus subvellereus]|nr:hypothetical protein BJV78DRAFT_1252171 [Lactifluus subvellereus]